MKNQLKDDRMSQAGEWPEIERRTTERRAEVNPVPRVGGNTKPEPADAASRAMLPVTDSWKHVANEWADTASSALVWLMNIRDGVSKVEDAIDNLQVSMADCRALELAQPAATPVAGWVSVEERLPEADAGPYLVASSWGVRVAYKHPPEWADGRFQDAITNCDEFDMSRDVSSTRMFVVTHWMPLPPAPVVTPTQQEQS